MLYQKKLFNLAFITLFSSLLFLLGPASNAQAEILSGTLKIKDTCWENGTSSSNGKEVLPLTIDLAISASPFISATLTFHDEEGDEIMAGSGLAIPKNSRSGTFHLFATDALVELMFFGKYKLDKLGNVAALQGNLISQDHNGLVIEPGLPCINTGKAKLKRVN